MLSKEKIIFIVLFFSVAFFVAPRLASAQVVINEIMYDLKGADDKHEWLEIKNTGSDEVDLTGWKLNDGDGTTNHALNAPPKNNGRGSLVLPANGFLLLADDALTLTTDLPNYHGSIIDTVLSLSNTFATLKLFNSAGQEMASAFYSKEMGTAGSGKTLEWKGSFFKESLAEGGTPGYTNDSGNQSPASPTPTPAPSASPLPAAPENETVSSPTPSPAPAPSFQYSENIFINEFLPYPLKDEKEWVELYNAGSETINLTGWQIDDEENSTSPLTIPDNTQIKSGEFLVVTMSKSMFNNDGDKIRLLWPDGQVVHSVSYQTAKQNQSCSRFDSQWLWTDSPTPGQANRKPSVVSSAIKSASSSPPPVLTREESAAGVQSISQNSSPNPAQKISNGSKTEPENPNIFAAGSLPNQKPENENKPRGLTSTLKTVLILLSVVFFSGLAGLGLVFFRRQEIDRQKTID